MCPSSAPPADRVLRADVNTVGLVLMPNSVPARIPDDDTARPSADLDQFFRTRFGL